ncbi:MAG: sigma-70 family RNA polymerase sigma factor [Pirellulaceae bacterium]|jgi:RNA polymerase primary sigma factor|nr:sigma-70 family RNA polymerase sigma factor [Pirellulaceae bacterium]MDP7016727.1 sigma-70 family RNA polymerase sigma factor [Pirellulaceae bacterium]
MTAMARDVRPHAPRGAANEPTHSNENLRQRAKRLLTTEIAFIGSRQFLEWSRANKRTDDALDWKQLTEDRWLEAEDERAWFWRLNYNKFRANQFRGQLSLEHPAPDAVATAEQLLAESTQIRNGLARVFLKLVISIAKGFASSRHPLDELLSEGNAILLRAIETFDADRGFRFSTYATHAIRRYLYRYVQKKTGEPRSPELFDQVPDPRRWDAAREQRMNAAMDAIAGFLNQLPDREQLIVRARFGLGDDLRPVTLQSIAEQLHVSRERVRQIEQRAIRKLRAMASAAGLDQLDL